MRYSVGDKVRIIDKWGIGCHENRRGKMDKWLGKIMTIREVDEEEEEEYYKMEEDINEHCDGWCWYEPSIAGAVEEEEENERDGRNMDMKDMEREPNFFDSEEVMSRAREYIEKVRKQSNVIIVMEELLEEISKGQFPYFCCPFCGKYKVDMAGNTDTETDDCSFEFGTCKREVIWHIVKGNAAPEDEEEVESVFVKASKDAAEKLERMKEGQGEARKEVAAARVEATHNPASGSTDPMVENPSHYASGTIECIDAIAAATENLSGVEAFDTGNAIKYLWRWKRKNGKQDLEKARWYVNHLIAHLAAQGREENH